MEYSEKVIEHFKYPQNAYKMTNADGEGSVGDYSCGDSLRMFIKVKDNVIEEISYLVYGCCASIATSSMTSILAKGKKLEEALEITEEDIIEALDGLPEEKKHCSNLGVRALKTAIADYKGRQSKSKFQLLKTDIGNQITSIVNKIVDHMIYRLFRR